MADLLQFFPWVVLAVVILADKASEWRLIGILSRLAERQPMLAPAPLPVPQPAPPVVVPPKVVPVPVPAPALPVPTPAPAPLTGPFAAAPPWFIWSLHQLGFHETGPNLGIEKFIAAAHTGSVGDPWCAIFANAALESVGVPGSRSPSSQSFRTHPAFVSLNGPALGCLVVYWRGSQSSGLGHVGFYVDETANAIRTLGGNENDMVQIEPLPKAGASFGLVGYWWPKSVALPKIGAIPTPLGSLAHVIVDPTAGQQAPAGPQAPHPLVDQTLIDAVKGFEGFSAKAYGDFKQYSIGYGTKANSPTEVITEPEAEVRLVAELSIAATSVEHFAPNAPAGVKRALTDLTYNVGPIWQQQGLGQLIKAGNYEEAKASVLQYNHAGGQVMAGLTKRRETEVSWFEPTAIPAVT